jgi:hypothetical protein
MLMDLAFRWSRSRAEAPDISTASCSTFWQLRAARARPRTAIPSLPNPWSAGGSHISLAFDRDDERPTQAMQ